MSEYISKSALIKAIEDEQQITVSNQCNFKDIVNSVPTVGAVPIRCGECKFRDTVQCPIADRLKNGETVKFFSPVFIRYCGAGERKEAPNE